MKIPRDLGGEDLVRLLKKYDYEITRQAGSHIRLTTNLKGEHHITMPSHKPLKVGTLYPSGVY
jgi:predicted RNA binding protein YcfA (HicA-like mRNA interferase family)